MLRILMIIFALNVVTAQKIPTFAVSYRGLRWTTARDLCRKVGKRLCLKKDICQRNSANTLVTRSSIQVPKRKTWLPVADQYNEWLYLGPEDNLLCEKLSNIEGPPFWSPRACQLNFITPQQTRKKRMFCDSRKGYFCCPKDGTIPDASPRPRPVYIFSRKDKTGPQYMFTQNKYLRESLWKTDQAAWRKTGQLNGDLSRITLMSGYVKGRFENPVYFCQRTIRNRDRLQTTQHKVSKTWCEGQWTLNFFMYASYVPKNATGLQKFIIGTSSSVNKHSRISLKEHKKFPTEFSIYGPFGSDSSDEVFTQGNRIVQDDPCKGKGETLTANSGIISSPNYPSKYNTRSVANVKCSWKIRGSFGSVVKISFKAINLPPPRRRAIPLGFRSFQGRKVARYNFNPACSFDRVDIKGYGRFCGNKLPPKFYTVGNEVGIDFFGRRGSTGTHFALYYEVIKPSHQLVEVSPRSSNTSFSWISANRTCFQKGKTLCNARDICISNSRPFYGVKRGDQWAPIQDEYNDWIQIGRGNIETCRRHNAVLGPPQWGLNERICLESNLSRPCPIRNHVYCCNYASTTSLPKDAIITINVYSVMQNGITFYKYIRESVDNAQSFDKQRIWRMTQRRRGGVTSFPLRSQRSPEFRKVVYFCSTRVVPSIGKIGMVFSLSLKPCEEKGWKHQYHLYSMNKPTVSAAKLYVGVYSKRPYHTHVNRIQFAAGFRSASAFIIHASSASIKSPPNNGKGPTAVGDDTKCKQGITVIESPTILQSPGYPTSYEANAFCRWLIIPPRTGMQKGDRLKLIIEELNLEDPVDVLNVKEINSTTANGAKTNQSSSVNGGIDFTGIVTQKSMTTGLSFLLTLTSDGSISGKGFRIRFDVWVGGCAGLIEQNGEILKSGVVTFTNKNYTSCFWSINAPPNHDIKIKFVSFDLTPQNDCPERIDIAFSGQRRIFCGGNIPPRVLPTDSDKVNITFVSPKSKMSNTLKRGGKFYIDIVYVKNNITSGTASPSHGLQCGVQSVPFSSADPVSDKIVNGKVAANGNFPWLVMIGRPVQTCGGTLVSNRLVLTATHCFVDRILPLGLTLLRAPLSKFVITAGRYQLNVPSPREQIFNVTAIFVHGGYQRYVARWINRDGNPYFGLFPYNDITLARLDREAVFSFTVKPACLPTQDANVGDFCYVAGWGSVSSTRVKRATKVNYARVPILDNSICNGWKEMENTIMENSLCAGFVRGGGDHCWGDSGGALVCRGKYGNFYVNGIVSWSKACAGTRTPGVYTRVWKYIEWIQRIMQ